MPLSDFTTPRSAICSMSRHFLPVLQPEPDPRLTTGLMKGSRLPVIEYLRSSCFSGLAASVVLAATASDALGARGAGLVATIGAADLGAGTGFTFAELAVFAGVGAGALTGTAAFVGAAALACVVAVAGANFTDELLVPLVLAGLMVVADFACAVAGVSLAGVDAGAAFAADAAGCATAV